jgi:hypothetical protein
MFVTVIIIITIIMNSEDVSRLRPVPLNLEAAEVVTYLKDMLPSY